MASELSVTDQEFITRCEEELKDRFTDKDDDFMQVFKSEPSVPPIIESWWVSNNSGRRYDRRNMRQYHPYDRHSNNRNRDRGSNDYNRDYNDRGHGHRQQQHRYRY